MKSQFNRAEQSPGFLLWKLTTEWQRQQRQALRAVKMTHVQFVFLACLQYLSEQQQEVTQSQLAEIAQLDKMVVSETAQRLLKKHLIMRKDHGQDSRSYTLILTAKGHHLIDHALPIVEKVDQQFFNKYKKQINLLAKIADKMSS